MRPSCAGIFRPSEGVGNAGCPMHPQPRVQCVGSTRVFTTGPPGSPGIPARNGFNGFLRALPGDRALLPPSSADIGCLSPVGPTCLRKLDASVGASGPHDFAVRSNISRQRAVDRSQAHHPPCDPLARKTLPRPSHPVPYVRDDRDTPLLWDGMAESINLFLPNGEAEYFCKEGWTAESTNRPSGKSPDGAVRSTTPAQTFMRDRVRKRRGDADGRNEAVDDETTSARLAAGAFPAIWFSVPTTIFRGRGRGLRLRLRGLRVHDLRVRGLRVRLNHRHVHPNEQWLWNSTM